MPMSSLLSTTLNTRWLREGCARYIRSDVPDRLTDEEQENYHSYVRIMAELDWPAYINGDTIFHQMIIVHHQI